MHARSASQSVVSLDLMSLMSCIGFQEIRKGYNDYISTDIKQTSKSFKISSISGMQVLFKSAYRLIHI